MRKKLTKEDVNERIRDRGFELIGEYISTNTKSLFRCPNSHEVETFPSGIMNGDGCIICRNINSTFTNADVNKKLKDRGITLAEKYTNNKTYTLFRCSNNHTWEAKPRSVMGGSGCPTCYSINRTLTKENVNERIKNRGIELIGDYIDTSHLSLFRCANNHKWKVGSARVLEGSGCPDCAAINRRLTKEDIQERIKDRGIEIIGEYIKTESRTLFRCINNHQWEATATNIMKGRGCPVCAVHGFKPNIPAHVYLLDFGHFIKFGISNTLKVRLRSHIKQNGNYTVIKTKLFENGQDALDWENNIKKKYGGSYVTKDICPQGFTETLPVFFKETLITMLDN